MPDGARDILAIAIDLHESFRHLCWDVTGQELSFYVKPDDIGVSSNGDSWRFFVEVRTCSPDWARLEIEKAIRNYPLAAIKGLRVEQGHTLMSGYSTSDDVGNWLVEQRGRDTG